MKKNTLKLTVILFALAGIFACQKENVDDIHFKEITIGSENPSINYSTNGIKFKFCLLNEESKPSTIFNEGENFSFYFSTTNNRNETLYFDYDFIYSAEPVFCRVYNSDGKDFGKSYQCKGATFISLEVYKLENNQKCVFQVPWIDNRSDWGWYSVALKNTQNDYLPQGKYYTEFEYNFIFRRTVGNDDNFLKIDKVKFKINFEIKDNK
ncbi:MAG: hypothetical protein LBT56_07665 [Prevotellaceae bacterium]|jgi:hypothetical protein|nr:hypothetical protein [Prevotellaceae bacterium]